MKRSIFNFRNFSSMKFFKILRSQFYSFLIILVSINFFILADPLDDLQPGEWVEISNTHLRSIAPNPLPPNQSGFGAVMSGWSGGVFDTQGNRLIVWGGGHADYSGNEVYSFNIDSLGWTNIWDHTPISMIPTAGENYEIYNDGNPSSRHTYDGLAYDSVRNSFFCHGGSKWRIGYGTAALWEFSLNSLTWTRKADAGNDSTTLGINLDFDPSTGHLFLRGNSKFQEFNPSTNNWTEHNSGYKDGGWWNGAMTSAIDPSRNVMLMVGGGDCILYDLSNKTYSEISTNDGSAIVNAAAPGLTFDSQLGKFVAWSGGTTLYSLDLDTLTWQSHLVAGSNTVSPTNPNPQGTFGRFQYVPSKNVYILVNHVDENVFFYKLSNGSGTSSPVFLGLNWQHYGDSETDGRATETPAALSPGTAFTSIWNSSMGSPNPNFRKDGVSGCSIQDSNVRYSAYSGRSSATWVHFQESGNQNHTGQLTPAEFAQSFEDFVRDIVADSPNAVITTESAYSFERESQAYRDWADHNIALRQKVSELILEGIDIRIAEVDQPMKDLVSALGFSTVITSDGGHFEGVGNLLVALSLYKSLNFNLSTLDLSGIPNSQVSQLEKNLCLSILGSGSADPGDTEAPSVPQNINSSQVTSSSLQLSWTASTDNVSVSGYKIYRDNLEIGNTVQTTYLDSGLNADTSYNYAVLAYDASANESALSGLHNVTTLSDGGTGQEETVIAVGDTWQYFKGTSAPPANWQDVGMDDSLWLSGATGIGYGDGDDATLISDMQNNYTGIFFRKIFTNNFATVNTMQLSIDIDDGFVAYLNGEEVARQNVSSSVIDNTAHADAATEPGTIYNFDLNSHIDKLNEGDNVLAIAVFNNNVESSDLSFIPSLTLQGETSPIYNGLIAYYAMNEGSGNTVSDLSGNQSNGVISGATWALGRMGNALSFDGSNDYVNLSEINVSGGSGFSCSLWFNANSFNTQDARLISKSNGTSEQNHDWMISTQSNSGMKMRFRLKADGTTLTLVGNTNIAVGQWIHVVATYDGNEMRLYQNNILDNTRIHSGAVNNSAGVNARIGQNPDGYGSFDGMIDEVRIYNRALTIAEINMLFDETQEPADQIAPSVPSNLQGNSSSISSITLTWDLSTDNVGVTGYRIFRDNIEIATTTQLTYVDSGLNEGTLYNYRVSAFDGAGNESAQCLAIQISTLRQLIGVLKEIQQLKISNSTNSAVNNRITDYFGGSAQNIILEWDASTDPVSGYTLFQATDENLLQTVSGALGDSNVTKYNVTALEQLISLASGNTYYFKVAAYDSEGIYSIFSNIDIDGGDASTGIQEGALEVIVP